ncbi:MAG: hypothetical protein IJQ39_06785 [Thermoguttaceae bacterium]|nr:hypothetical protein [Thermoguttaceae bacterium]
MKIQDAEKKQGKMVAKDGTVKNTSGTLNGTLKGGQIGGQMSGQIDNAGICDSVNHKFETPPENMKMKTRSYPHLCFRSLPKNSRKNFCSNQIKEMGL